MIDHFTIFESMSNINDENKSYVAFNEVIDDEGHQGVRFTVIFTTPTLVSRMSPELIQDDATYRFSFQPFFITN